MGVNWQTVYVDNLMDSNYVDGQFVVLATTQLLLDSGTGQHSNSLRADDALSASIPVGK